MQTEVLIIGCGVAGAAAALELARDRERRVTVVTRASRADDSSSTLAQGGIVGRGRDDTRESLMQDVLRAGAGLCWPPAVQVLAEEGPRLVEQLLVDRAGVAFDRDENGPVFALEAAHSRRRVLHVGDSTGETIVASLLRRLAEAPNVELLASRTVVDLLTFPHHSHDPLAIYEQPTCRGAYVLDETTGRVETLLAAHTLLATGGLGQIFLNTSNPPGARGDGVAMAYRAGADVINAEYVQFHPTVLHMPGTTCFLISEAVRGEGAQLITPDGDAFMARHAPEWKDLAPRYVVARAIYEEMLRNDYPYVLLDLASHRPVDFIRQRFPRIHARCLEQNVDITRQPIPVVPAAHYFCGGVRADLWGRTSLAGLWAVGEVACTGVHGANRLASTSLLEGIVWGTRAARDVRRQGVTEAIAGGDVPAWDDSGLTHDADPALIQGDLQTIRNLMWHYAGLIRNEYRLDRAIRELRHLWANIEEFYRRARLSDGLIGLRNAVQVALIVAGAARRNAASRGCHYREDGQGAATQANADPGASRVRV